MLAVSAPNRRWYHGEISTKVRFMEPDAKAYQRAHAHCGVVSHQQGISGEHPHLCFGFVVVWLCLQAVPPVRTFRGEEWNRLGITTRYYPTDLHTGAFALPAYVEKLPQGS